MTGAPLPPRRQLGVEDYVKGVLSNDRTILARAVTLIESSNMAHIALAQKVLQQLLPHTGKSVRIGLTGVPGAGKSTLLDALGKVICDQGHRLAILAIDPSSQLNGGSILGDKTRMEELSRRTDCFIRPSPSAGSLGGVHRKTRETMLLCEAAGFDVIIVETVGIGQNEGTVRTMVDFFLLLVLTGAGDELQGIKKGVMELADALFINKADGANLLLAKRTQAELNQVLHYLAPATPGWMTQAHLCSGLKHEGLEEMWRVIQKFCKINTESGEMQKRRTLQNMDWMHEMINAQLSQRFFMDRNVQENLKPIEREVMAGRLPVTSAVQQLFNFFENGKR